MQQNQKLTFFGKRNGLAFQNWTFLKCPFSENRDPNLINVFLWDHVLWELFMGKILLGTIIMWEI